MLEGDAKAFGGVGDGVGLAAAQLALRGDDKARAAAAVEAMEADAADAIANMALVDAIYAASGLRQRAPTDPWY